MNIQAFDFSTNLLRALLWQHNDATRLESLITQKDAWYDSENREFWDDWIRDVFDLQTANDFGLSVWAIILGIALTPPGEPDEPDKPIFGFALDDENFSNGNFATWFGLPLTTAQRRLVLQMRYFQLVTRATVPEVNAFMSWLFNDLGAVYVVDTGGMRARYVFDFPLSADLEAVIAGFDLLPRPAGVRVDYVVVPDAETFGFDRFRLNFNNGNFYHG